LLPNTRFKNKYFTKRLLIEANNAGIKENRSRLLNESFLESLSEDKVYPVLIAFHHTKGEIRTQIAFDERGTRGFLDLSEERFDFLPKSKTNEDGLIKLESEESINARLPYGIGREYEQKYVRKIVRDSSFRKRILSNYDNQCAMCTVKNPSMLVAAHIYPARLCDDDTSNNGICLCANHDKGYENGDILVNSEGYITVRDGESKKSMGIAFEKIRLPQDQDNHPSLERLNQRFELSLKKLNRKK